MNKYPLKRSATILASVSVVLGLVTACGPGQASQGSSSSSNKPREGGSIVLDSTGTFKDLDPALCYDGQSQELVTAMYDQLVTYKGSTSQIIPDLAESWDVSKDGMTYTFHLHKGVTFWNGDPLTAANFVDEFKRVLDPQVGSPGEMFIDPIIKGSTAYAKGKAKTISGITTPDPYTLKIQLTKPEPFFNEVMALSFFSPVDQKFIDKVGAKAYDAETAMGTGPFMLKQYETTGAELVKNPHYWAVDKAGNRLPYLDSVTIDVNQNSQMDSMRFEEGETALMGNLIGVPSGQYPLFVSVPKLKSTMTSLPHNEVAYLGMNLKVAPFNNLKVRQAVEYAIDKSRMTRLENNRVQPANQPLPPQIKGYVSKLPADATYNYNPEKAKQLIQEAGIKKGNTITLYSDNEPDEVKIDSTIQADLDAVGLQTKIDTLDFNTFLDMEESGKTGLFLTNWSQDFPDASDFLNTLFNTNEQPTNNTFAYSNPQVDQWLNTAQADLNEKEREQLYAKVTEEVMKDAPMVPLYYPVQYSAVQPWLHGYYINPSLADPLATMWVDPGHDQSS